MDLYSKTNANKLNKDLMQPNMVKRRHRYKGHRESEKINLEMDQVRYDLLLNKKKLDELLSKFEQLFHLIGLDEEEFIWDTNQYSDVENAIHMWRDITAYQKGQD